MAKLLCYTSPARGHLYPTVPILLEWQRRGHELALVTMLFVVPLIFGIWEVGRLIHVQQVVSNSAREGARLEIGRAHV